MTREKVSDFSEFVRAIEQADMLRNTRDRKEPKENAPSSYYFWLGADGDAETFESS